MYVQCIILWYALYVHVPCVLVCVYIEGTTCSWFVWDIFTFDTHQMRGEVGSEADQIRDEMMEVWFEFWVCLCILKCVRSVHAPYGGDVYVLGPTPGLWEMCRRLLHNVSNAWVVTMLPVRVNHGRSIQRKFISRHVQYCTLYVCAYLCMCASGGVENWRDG